MRRFPTFQVALVASILAAGCVASGGAIAQSPSPAAKPAAPVVSPAPAARAPSMGQMAARDRQKKCGVEWKDAKAGGKTGGLKWPQYWSKCNARLKGNSA